MAAEDPVPHADVWDRYERATSGNGDAQEHLAWLTASVNDVPYLLTIMKSDIRYLMEVKGALMKVLAGVLKGAPKCWEKAGEQYEDIAIAYVQHLEAGLNDTGATIHYTDCDGHCTPALPEDTNPEEEP